MEDGFRETACDNCVHKDVCKYKDDYLYITKMLEKNFNNVPNGKNEEFEFKDPECKRRKVIKIYSNKEDGIK